MIRYKNQLKQRQKGREEAGPAYCLRNVELCGDLEGIQSLRAPRRLRVRGQCQVLQDAVLSGPRWRMWGIF